MSKKLAAGVTALCVALLCAVPLSLRFSPKGGVAWSLDSAGAVIGRPLTPLSVAGVHRRAYRRAYHGYGYGAYARPYGYGTYQTRSYGYGYGAYQPSPYAYGYGAYRPSSYGYGYGTYQPSPYAYGYGTSQPIYDTYRYGYGNQPVLYDVMPGYDADGRTVWILNPDRFGGYSQY